ncbi:hypothetical protein EDM57_12480 [Brevibacillus gelatini]|uniref:Uncharacterized protein n=1 Tax=Brevibacillus gelatini TaxID=1655277 RepID=A0A3M8AZJ6_9BACL|nr:hypothetical protein EDM57_12480 [Brevibacillus gelatini]
MDKSGAVRQKICSVIKHEVRLNVVKNQMFIQSLIEASNRRAREEKSLEELFKRPILHRQINGNEVYVPLDLVRLGWKVES